MMKIQTIKLTRPTFVIGIDPDVDGSGVAVLEVPIRALATCRYKLPALANFLEDFRGREDILVVVEASYLIKGNWHIKSKDSIEASSAIGQKIGRNHEIGRQIVEFCKYFHIPYEEKLPLKKVWKKKDGKISKDELEALCRGSGIGYKLAGYDQEQMDATLLAIDRSGIPMIMETPKKLGKLKAKQ